jgi:transcriptional regulator with XRE-family HTH domain
MAKLQITMGEHFGQWLRSRREGMGLSLRAFAKRAGVSHALIDFLERGERDATPEVRIKLAGALGIAVDDVRIATFPDEFSERDRELLRRWLDQGGD